MTGRTSATRCIERKATVSARLQDEAKESMEAIVVVVLCLAVS